MYAHKPPSDADVFFCMYCLTSHLCVSVSRVASVLSRRFGFQGRFVITFQVRPPTVYCVPVYLCVTSCVLHHG